MQIVIDIPKEVKNRLCFGVTYSKDIQVVCEALNDGTQLPKGHGRLIDVDALKAEIRQWQRDILNPEARRGARLAEAHYQDLINKTPTIIEADKAEREG